MRLFLVVCCLTKALFSLWAQSENVRFYNHSRELESSWVTSVKSSTKGEVWIINNDNLIHYNGYEKKILNLTKSEINPVFVNTVALADDALWIGTQEELRHYDLITHKQIRFDIGAVGAVHLDETGVLWADSDKGLIKIDEDKNISFLQDSSSWGSLAVFDFQHDGNGLLWIATEGNGVLTYHTSSGTFQKINGLTNVNQAPQLKMRDLLLDQDGSIWAGSSGGGLFHLTGDDITQFLPSDAPGSISTTEAYTLEQDNDGNLWIGTWAGGLNFFDVNTEQFTNYKTEENQSNGLPSNVIIDLHIQGNQLWLATAYSGLWMTQLDDRAITWWSKENSPVPLDHDNFWSIHEDKGDNLWLGTFQGGLYKISPQQEMTHFRPFVDIPANTVWTIFENSTGLWFGTHRGLLLQRSGSEEMTFFSTSSNQPAGWEADNIFVIEGDENRLYLGIWGAGIYEYDIQQNSTRKILSQSNISDLELTAEGILWVACNAELFTYDPRADSIAQPALSPLKAPRPATLLEAHDGLWLASKDGLFHRGSGQFEIMDHELLIEVLNPIEARDSTLWVATAYGLVKISKDRRDIQLVPEQDRTISQTHNARAVARTNDGKIYFGGHVGIVAFNPEDINLNEPLAEIRIDEFKIGNQPIITHEGVAPEHASSFNLTHEDLVFSFDFSAINYTHPQDLNYAYQLSGISDEWIYTSARNRRASFAGLAPGQYQFHVKAQHPGSAWGPTKTININMAPPWWKTNLAFVFYVLGISLIVLSAHRLRLAGHRRNEKRLKTEIARQTQRLQENNEELAVKNKELKSLSKFKEGLTHMIVHDMKNPLNAVIGLTDGKPTSDHINQIRQSGQTILQMITNMLDIQKFEEVEIQVNPEVINLYNLVVEATKEVNMLLVTRGIILQNKVSTDISVFIDKNIILRVFINLFTNAIKYSSSGSTITVNANIIEDRVLLDVADQGMGIAKEALPNIFNKFWQYKARKSGEISSTGLGLTYSKLAIESHKGKISVSSNLNEGATFHFDLPYHGKSGEAIVFEDIQGRNEYSDLAKRKINALSIMIKDIPLYNVGKILKILQSDDEEEELTEVEKWKSSVLDATYHHDQQRFEELTSI